MDLRRGADVDNDQCSDTGLELWADVTLWPVLLDIETELSKGLGERQQALCGC